MKREDTQFKPGHTRGSGGGKPGNQNARKAGVWKHALERALARFAAKNGYAEDRDQGLDLVANKVVEAAAEGDATAWQEIANRMDGKAKEHVVLDVHRAANELSDEELIDIARGGSAGTDAPPTSPQDDTSVH